jgi:hypothetical protein
MREDFEVVIGGAGTLRVQAIVRHRQSDETRNSGVIVRDEGNGDELWLSCREAEALGQFLARGGEAQLDGHSIEEFAQTEGSGDAPDIRVVANQNPVGAVTVVRQYSTRLRDLLNRATEAISMVERLDALREAAEPELM